MLKQINLGYTQTNQKPVFRNPSVLKVVYDVEHTQGYQYFIDTNVRTRIGSHKVRVVVFKIAENIYSVRTAVAPCTLRYIEEYGVEIAKINNPLAIEMVLLNDLDPKFIVQ